MHTIVRIEAHCPDDMEVCVHLCTQKDPVKLQNGDVADYYIYENRSLRVYQASKYPKTGS